MGSGADLGEQARRLHEELAGVATHPSGDEHTFGANTILVVSPKHKAKQQKIRAVFRGLRRMYGDVAPPERRRGVGLNTLVEAMLAQNTNMANAERGYRMLRRRFVSWKRVMEA